MTRNNSLLIDKLEELEKKTGQPKAFFLLGGVSVIALAIYALGGTKLVTDLVSFIYPAYMSFKGEFYSNRSSFLLPF